MVQLLEGRAHLEMDATAKMKKKMEAQENKKIKIK